MEITGSSTTSSWKAITSSIAKQSIFNIKNSNVTIENITLKDAKPTAITVESGTLTTQNVTITGDNLEVTKCICKKVGINSNIIVEGSQIEKLSDSGVLRLLKKSNIFVKLSPIQKARIVRLLKDSNNVVGYMGDGINDAPSLINSDVGISVDTAVDIAKESADIILLEKDLHILLDGVSERKKNFCKFNEIYKIIYKF